jgi:ABC-type Mn2+/Zn2+ transport system permease subunit
VIIPAATAKYLARGLPGMLGIAVAVAVFSTAGGTVLAARLHRAPGPIIIAMAAAFFFVGLLRPRSG